MAAPHLPEPARRDDWQGIMAERVYCTYFDHNYLPRGLALYHSLQRHASGRAAVGALPQRRLLSGPGGARLCPRWSRCGWRDFEAADPAGRGDAAHAQPDRILLHLLAGLDALRAEQEPEAEWVTYLDSDLFFFASPEPIYAEMKDASFGIIPHHFARRLAQQQRFGIYNVGWVSVANTERARGAALVARALHRVVLRFVDEETSASPTSAISTACRNCFRTSTSSSISAPIWRPGILPTGSWSGVTDRCGSTADTICCSSTSTA